jgi:hypothetical protein
MPGEEANADKSSVTVRGTGSYDETEIRLWMGTAQRYEREATECLPLHSHLVLSDLIWQGMEYLASADRLGGRRVQERKGIKRRNK